MFDLTKNELEVLELMWEQDRPLTRTEIINLSPERSWKAGSIHILLNRLLDKEAIIVDGFVKTGKNYGRTYSAAVTRKDYDMSLFKQHYESGNISIGELFAALIEDEKYDDSVIDELEAIIKKRKAKDS